MCKKVVGRTYYHVTHSLSYNQYAPLRPGQTIIVGNNYNPFFSFYERVVEFPVNDAGKQVSVKAVAFLRQVCEGHIQCATLPKVAYDVANHYVTLTREILMEQVRGEISANLPSRQRCIWACDNLESARRWRAHLNGNSPIVKIEATGWAHDADAALLLGDSEPLSTTIEKARLYWQGERSDEPHMETLVCGSVRVMEVIG